MPASLMAGRTRLRAQPVRLGRLFHAALLALAVFVVAFAGLAPFAARAAIYNPFIVVIVDDTQGKPSERIEKYLVREGAAQYLVDGGKFLDTEALAQVTDATLAYDRNAALALAAEEGWAWYALSAGWTGSAGTFAEHALKIPGLSNATNALTNIGGALTVIQVTIDLAKGDTKAASIDALKGLTSFAIGKFGSSALQLGGIAFFVVDLTLTSFGNAAWAEREQAWRHVYQLYYRDMDKAALNAPRSGNDLTSRFKDIRSRIEGGRSLNDWKVIVSFYFKHAKSPELFKQLIDTDIHFYVKKFWNSPNFLEHSADGDWSTAGFARASSLTQAIKDKLEAEHADAIRSKLVKEVFPEVQKRAVADALKAEAERLNGDWRDRQNEMMTVEVSAFNIDAPTRFEMIKPNGGSWGGSIAPGEPRKLRITRYALTRAGFPDTIRLHTPDGPVDKTFVFENGKAVVVFGAPQSSMVTEMSRTESGLSCTLKVTDADGQVTETSETRPAPAPQPIHFAAKPDGTMVMGQFSIADGWQIASPGGYSDQGLRFGAPYFEDIESISGCGMVRADHDFFGTFAEQNCTVIRATSDKGPDGALRELRCTSRMSLKLSGGFTPIDGVMTYAKLDPELFEELEEGYEDALEQMQNLPGGAGMALPDLNVIPGGQ